MKVYAFVKELVIDDNIETLADKLGSYGVTIPQYQQALQQQEKVTSS